MSHTPRAVGGTPTAATGTVALPKTRQLMVLSYFHPWRKSSLDGFQQAFVFVMIADPKPKHDSVLNSTQSPIAGRNARGPVMALLLKAQRGVARVLRPQPICFEKGSTHSLGRFGVMKEFFYLGITRWWNDLSRRKRRANPDSEFPIPDRDCLCAVVFKIESP
jgi:hypothetical protein